MCECSCERERVYVCVSLFSCVSKVCGCVTVCV